MKFSVNWLREFVELPPKVEELAELLTMAGVEIEGMEQRGANIDKVVVAQISSSAQHPNADRLSVCQVEDGSGQTRQIVCGAKNYKVGDKVPLALPGRTLPNGTKIRESKLRGVESQGMLCSAIELGLGDDAAGLLILSPDAKIGTPISDLFPSDTILDVEITPNRGDLLSHYGLAREISALVANSSPSPLTVEAAVSAAGAVDTQPARLPLQKAVDTQPARLPLQKISFGETSLPVRKDDITLSAPNECPFFSLRRIEGVTVGPSPAWLRTKIEAAGIRSINNIVDISNFVMLELGQPTHAFDADKLRGGIIVRMAQAGEKFLALDGKTYALNPQDLVIADQERVVGIAGVMGGEETGVTESTRNVLLEAACFLPSSIRRTARRLNLPSDASYRFERGVDPKMILPASQRATALMTEIAGGKPADEIGQSGHLPDDPAPVDLKYVRCHRLIGVDIPSVTIDQTLTRFGLNKEPKTSDASAATWAIPSYRRDLRRDVDLIEEVVRALGVQNVTGTDRSRFTATSSADLSHDFESALRERLVGRGLSEARTSKLIPRQTPAFGENAVGLRNPLSEDHVALRPSLMSGLLGVLERNVRAGAEKVAIFELGRVFLPPDAKEEKRLGIILWGNETGAATWRGTARRGFDLFDLKGAIESIVSEPLAFQRSAHPDLGLAMEIRLGDKPIGLAGQLAGPRAAELDANGTVLVAELNWESIFTLASAPRAFREIEKFPAITRDIAMVVPETIAHEQIVRAIENPREPLLRSVELFDLFSGTETNNLGAARKSLAYRLTYRDKNRTLTTEEVTAAHARIRERLQSELGAELRE
jgi:phenylalanyl-tRNA synthetase beta chain